MVIVVEVGVTFVTFEEVSVFGLGDDAEVIEDIFFAIFEEEVVPGWEVAAVFAVFEEDDVADGAFEIVGAGFEEETGDLEF